MNDANAEAATAAMPQAISASRLSTLMTQEPPPIVIDVRRKERWQEATNFIDGALRRDPQQVDAWAHTLPAASAVVVYCVHGHEVSRNAAKSLAGRGLSAAFLDGGIEHWRAEGGRLQTKPAGASTRWVTRERPKIDRIACPWLIRRFIDPAAEFLYVPPADVARVAREREALPYDVPGVAFSHEGERCSFDAFVRRFNLRDPALDALATIVRGADTGHPELAPQSAGLLAISLGLSRTISDDHAMLEQGMVIYDALYSWCKKGKAETHAWNPDPAR